MTSVVQLIPFETQIGVWGAAWEGDLAEVTAMLSERAACVPMHPWDHDAGYLRTGAIISDEGVTTLPYRYALPFAADYMIRMAHDTSGTDES